MADIFGYKSGPLPRFRPVLEQWIEANDRYCRVSHWKDIPWGYNERASLSTFAAASWLAGAIALEEYVEDKNPSTSSTGKIRRTKGRCDLYVAFRGETKGYILEAKIIWPSLSSKNWGRTIIPMLDTARKDVQRTRAHSGEKKLGLLFVIPYIPKRKAEFADKSIGSFVDFLRSHEDICSAWTFPNDARGFYWRSDKERIYPGTAVLLQPLRRGRVKGE